jgi:hypothetical protein
MLTEASVLVNLWEDRHDGGRTASTTIVSQLFPKLRSCFCYLFIWVYFHQHVLNVRHLPQESGRRTLLWTEEKHDMSVAASLVLFGLETKVKWSYMKLKFKTKGQKWKESMKKILTFF